MGAGDRDLGHATLERLVARASALDEERAERITLAQGREIARELGISAAAWDSAVREHLARRPGGLPGELPSGAPSAPRRDGTRAFLTALAGFGAGLLCGAAVAGPLRGWDTVLGATLIAVALVLVASGAARRSQPAAQRELALWWLTVPLGLTLGLGSLNEDVGWFALNSWVGTAAFGAATPFVLGRLRSRRSRRTSRAA